MAAKEAGAFHESECLLLLPPDGMVKAKGGVLDPDLLPVLQSVFGDCICYRMPAGEMPRSGQFVTYSHETGGQASLGSSFSAVLQFAWWLMGSRYLAAQCTADTLARTADILEVLLQEPLPASPREDPVFGFTYQLDTPASLCARAEDAWARGMWDTARDSWLEAVQHDEESGAAHWGLGLLHAASGEVADACLHFAACVEGNWCSACPDLLTRDVRLWSGVPFVAMSFLRASADGYICVSRRAAVRQIVLSGGFDASAVWQAELERCVREGQLADAKVIALGGLGPRTWHDGGRVEDCAKVLREIVVREGFGNRAAC